MLCLTTLPACLPICPANASCCGSTVALAFCVPPQRCRQLRQGSCPARIGAGPGGSLTSWALFGLAGQRCVLLEALQHGLQQMQLLRSAVSGYQYLKVGCCGRLTRQTDDGRCAVLCCALQCCASSEYARGLGRGLLAWGLERGFQNVRSCRISCSQLCSMHALKMRPFASKAPTRWGVVRHIS